MSTGHKDTADRNRRRLLEMALAGIGLALLPLRTAEAKPRGTVVKRGWVLRADD